MGRLTVDLLMIFDPGQFANRTGFMMPNRMLLQHQRYRLWVADRGTFLRGHINNCILGLPLKPQKLLVVCK